AAEDVVVSLVERRVVSRAPIDPVTDGQVPLLTEEHDRVRQIMAADEGWSAALAKRGITDPATVFVAALSAGHYDEPPVPGRRIARVLAHHLPTPGSLPWAYPIDGLVA